MYGWTSLLAALVLCGCRVGPATGSSIRRTVFERLEDNNRESSSRSFRVSTTHNCTEDENTRTVRCFPSSQEGGMSMCCSVIVRNSSHFRPPCTPITEAGGSSQSSQLNATMLSAPTDCTLRIPASSSNSRRKRPLVSYELSTCVGSNLHVVCEANLSCSDRGVAWRREGETFQGHDLRIKDVQRRDSGVYACEVTDYFEKKRVGAVVVVIAQFPPMLTVPKPRIGRPLECSAEADPPATVKWYRDEVPLTPAHHDWYIVTSETANCTTRSHLRLLPPMMEGNSTSPDPTEGNFTCVASNRHGQTSATLTFPESQDEFVSQLPTDNRRRFNVTGFIVGMLPPLFISFYIILKLGYRSRYAVERGEDDGYREEPFFIGY